MNHKSTRRSEVKRQAVLLGVHGDTLDTSRIDVRPRWVVVSVLVKGDRERDAAGDVLDGSGTILIALARLLRGWRKPIGLKKPAIPMAHSG